MRILFIFLLFFTSVFANEYSKQELEKMIAKMVILGFQGTNIDQNSQISKDIKKGLGGVILFDKDPNDKTKAKNIESKAQLKKLNSDLQKQRVEKLLISIDQEGGIVQRLKSDIGFVNTLKASEVSKNGEDFAKLSYRNLARDLKSVGINLDFAPVVDLAINKQNKVIVTRGRSFGDDPKTVEKYATIFIDEMKKESILSTLKHFPGHGSSLADSHLGFVDISKTWSKKELEPYKNLIKNNKADIIMSAHVFNENLDKNYPATLSYNVNTKLLREQLGFQGVLITDDLQMSAISKHYTIKETLTLAINSGVNLLLFANQLAKPITLDEIIKIVYDEVLNKNIDLEKIIESNKKIDKLLKKI
ncbi:glycoside hydrolase family 3 protein [Arcobacter vandammei]|uniref:glycoside hydrolase family 3 protein n=1 Tax=Arcobacter vandammei TaxID=2782243 RepID=UPI0018E04D2E|nr:glycoside hydrolase family 3 protein [Arcobacter vandammei]